MSQAQVEEKLDNAFRLVITARRLLKEALDDVSKASKLLYQAHNHLYGVDSKTYKLVVETFKPLEIAEGMLRGVDNNHVEEALKLLAKKLKLY